MPLIFGETSSGLMVPLLLESDGSLPQANKGWIGAAWQKNPLQFGYSGDWSERKSNTNADAGTNTLVGTSVPAGEVWVLEAVAVKNNTKAAVRLVIYLTVNGENVALRDFTTTVATEHVTWSGAVTLSEGDTVNGAFHSCDAGDDLYLDYHARRVDIDQ